MMKKLAPVIFSLVLILTGLAACNPAITQSLPRSMKGYELYSWQEEGRWHFTLITGTNRNKTYAEMISKSELITEDGWVRIQVEGTGEIKNLLDRLPEGESVFWSGGHFVDEPVSAEIHPGYPPQDIIDEIKAHAEKCELEFYAPL